MHKFGLGARCEFKLNAPILAGAAIMLITFSIQHTGVFKTAKTQFLLALLSLIPMLLLGIVPILTGKIDFANFFPLIPEGTTSWFSTESFTLMMGEYLLPLGLLIALRRLSVMSASNQEKIAFELLLRLD